MENYIIQPLNATEFLTRALSHELINKDLFVRLQGILSSTKSILDRKLSKSNIFSKIESANNKRQLTIVDYYCSFEDMEKFILRTSFIDEDQRMDLEIKLHNIFRDGLEKRTKQRLEKLDDLIEVMQAEKNTITTFLALGI